MDIMPSESFPTNHPPSLDELQRKYQQGPYVYLRERKAMPPADPSPKPEHFQKNADGTPNWQKPILQPTASLASLQTGNPAATFIPLADVTSSKHSAITGSKVTSTANPYNKTLNYQSANGTFPDSSSFVPLQSFQSSWNPNQTQYSQYSNSGGQR